MHCDFWPFLVEGHFKLTFYVDVVLKGNTTFVLEELMKNTACI